MRLRSTILIIMFGVLAFGAPGTLLAQGATPTAQDNGFPIVPDPALCTVQPRPAEELLNLWYPSDASPTAEIALSAEPPTEVTIPVGQPAGAVVEAEIRTTVHEAFSCFAADDLPRALALFTDDLVRVFMGEPWLSRDEMAAILEETPEPSVDEADAEVLLAITNVMLLEDGRVGAFLVDSNVDGTFTAYMIFEQVDGRWLVDEWIGFTPEDLTMAS